LPVHGSVKRVALKMKIIGSIGIAATLFLSSALSYAQNHVLEKGKSAEVCKRVLKEVNQTPTKYFDYRDHKLFNNLEWQKGSYSFINPNNGDKHTQGIKFTEFDINNDGTDELITKETTTLRFRDGEFLFVFDKGSFDFTKNPELRVEQVRQFRGIHSFIPWPYDQYGLGLVEVFPFRYKEVNYAGIVDIDFDSGHGRLIIATYTGISIQYSEYANTDKLNVICQVKKRRNK
jgi:hypothetical protein